MAYALFLPLGMDWSYAAMFPGLLLSGITFGPLTIAATDTVAEEEQGLARRPTERRGARGPLRGQRRRSGGRPTTTAAPSPSRLPYQPPLPCRPLVSLTGNAAPRLLMAR